MTLLLVVPERLKIMAIDASLLMRDGSAKFVPTLDVTRFPFVEVEIQNGDYPPVAAGVEEPVEEFTINLLSSKFGQQARGDAEDELRQIATDVIGYFRVRSQLQFSNLRGIEPSTLPALNGVMWARLYLRTFCGVVEKAGAVDGPFYGCTFTVRVQEVVRAEEVLV